MPDDGFAVAAYREAGEWRCELMPPAVLDDLDTCIAAVRQQPGEGGGLGLIDIEDEFFIAIRPRPTGGVSLLLSDASAALDWDLARQALEQLGEDLPDDDEAEEIWPAGDLHIFDDLGMPSEELRIVVDDLDLYADEMLAIVAKRLGFAAAYTRTLDGLRR